MLKPDIRVSKSLVRQCLDAAEEELRSCFDLVAMMKAGQSTASIGNDILSFQPRLLKAIQQLEALYLLIRREQKCLISRKLEFQRAWFARRMATLAAYQDALKGALAVARAIGDGFAYFFYARDRNLIDEHLKQQRQPLLPPGAGGLGERLTLERMQGFDGKFLLYHGLTTFLRLGDVTFIDMAKARVAYIAELKTKQVTPQSTTVEIVVVAPTKEGLPKPKLRKLETTPTPLPQSLRARRERQIREIGEAFDKSVTRKTDRKLSLNGGFHFRELDQAVESCGKRDVTLVRAGPSMLIGALQLQSEPSLAGALLGNRGLPRHFGENVPKASLGILDSELGLNSLIVGSIGDPDSLAMRQERLPLAWWPAEPETIRRVLFSEVAVVTLYNPAHFWKAIRERGFNLLDEHRGRYRKACRPEANGRLMELENFSYFESLTPRALLSLDSVLAMIDDCLGGALDKHHGGSMRVDFLPHIM